MLVSLIALLQVASPSAVTAPASAAPSVGATLPDKLKVGRTCPTSASGDEVVVCGRSGQERFRLRPLPLLPDKGGPPRAEARLGSGTVGVRAQDAGVGGFASHRVMMGVKLPF